MSSILHSRFLVHWTGKDFHPAGAVLNNDARARYVDRLVDNLRHGFYMKPGDEFIWGPNNESIKATVSRVCFTEIKLSLAKSHAYEYGMLGIGVNREYVLERFGGPVFYVQNGITSNVIENFHKVSSFLESQFKEIPDATEILKHFGMIAAYVKNMSERNNTKLTYYDEMEWRVVHSRRLHPTYVSNEDSNRFIYRLRIAPDDVKVIVFPDAATMHMALQRPEAKELIVNSSCVVLDHCEDF